MIVKKEFLKDKLEPFIYEKLSQDEYKIIEKNPRELLSWNCLIVAFNNIKIKIHS